MKPVIGVFPSVKSDKTFWLYESCSNALIDLGALPIVIPTVSDSDFDALFDIMNFCDGFMFTGGIDIDPSFYGEQRQPECGDGLKKRDTFELFALKYALNTGKPILGICRGCQLINVALGGTLCQDISKAYPSANNHTSISIDNPTIHEIEIPIDSPLFELSGTPRVKINSFHHQCVDRLGEGLKILAMSDDGIPEGVYLDGDGYVVGVQWHPERSYKTSSLDKNVFSDFIEASKRG